MRNFRQLPQSADLKVAWEVPVPEIPADRMVILPNVAAYDAIHPMVAKNRPYLGYGAPMSGSHYSYGTPPDWTVTR